MRKTIFMIALIVGASFTTANATEGNNESVNLTNKVTVTKIAKVNSFCIAIAKGDFDTVKKMIQFGENVNKTSNGKTPLMYAARYNRVEIINLLLENGAKVDAKDNDGRTAVDYAKISKALQAKKVLENASK
ncbi:ankyrin repeat domain-containing protein [uncultured Kordia sp.]|uniref:ankyrin repeat domain-containing protein n=1 Tax=uncultured Kordia sp. TaxID=507699 RepID=UPI0026145374|nr:ankyrin repeat domain-containing protein [uncultured Kordia sp.]